MTMLKHAIIAALITALLFKSGVFVFIVPLPLLYVFAVYGRKAGYSALLAVAVVAGLSIVFRLENVYDVIYLSYFMLIGILLGEGVIKKFSVMKLAGLAMIVPWVVVMGMFFLAQFVLNVPIVSGIEGYLANAADQGLKMQDSVATLSAPQMAYVREHMSEIVGFMLNTLPAAIFLFNMLVVSVTIVLARSLTKKFHTMKYLGNVAAQRFPFWPVWTTIICGMLYFANAYMFSSPYIKFGAINGLLICAGLFFIQGCFVITFWLHRGRSPFLKILVYGLIIAFLQVVGFIIIVLGLSDQWIDFRKRILNHQTTA